MTRLELTALIAGMLAAGMRANPGDEATVNGLSLDADSIARRAAAGAKLIVQEVEDQGCGSDNAPFGHIDEPEA